MLKANNPMRVLHITEELSAAGIESFIMNIYRQIDRSKVQFDFLVLRNEKEFYDDEIASLGGNKYVIHSKKDNTFVRILDETKKMQKFLETHPYDIVHIHYTTPLRAPYLYAAYKANVKTRIYHSHSAYITGKSKAKMLVYRFMKNTIAKWSTHCFACSKAAAEWMYPQTLLTNTNSKVSVIYNGINTQKYKFNIDARKEIRQELKLEDQYVLIHVGRFSEQKNQSFIIDIFSKIIEKRENVSLLLLGTGEMLEEMKQKAKMLGMEKQIKFLGVKDDVNRYLSAADCYIMPSLYEGLPVAAVEAQCSGLPCVFSENITREIELIPNVKFLSLDTTIDEWVEAVLQNENLERRDFSEDIRNKGYEEQKIAFELQNFYLNNSCGNSKSAIRN